MFMVETMSLLDFREEMICFFHFKQKKKKINKNSAVHNNPTG
jgi:hypothetical protein